MSSEPATAKPGLLIVLCGPSGVGKSTISRKLAEEHGVTYIVSATTRPHKTADEQGKKYEHVSREEFFRRLDANEFLEYAEVYDNYYGTPRKSAVSALESGRDVLLEIDVQGALQVRCQFPKAATIFLLPPDEPTLLNRLESRGRDSPDVIARRFRSAKREICMARGSRAFDDMIVNDDLDRAVKQIVQFIEFKRNGGI